MKKKIVWLVVSGWMVAALLVASCAPAVVEEEEVVVPEEEVVVPEEEVVVPEEEVVPEEGPEMVKWTGTKVDGTVVEKMLEKPRYGGKHITARANQPSYFDDTWALGFSNFAGNPVYETLMTRDWARGPVGTGEWSGSYFIYPLFHLDTGSIAESWELVSDEDSDNIIFHIRKGMYWHDKPPLNGRQLTADDVVYSLRRNWTIGYFRMPARGYILKDMENVENSIYISPDDPWAVVLECDPGTAGYPMMGSSTPLTHIIPPEILGGDYKSTSKNSDWKNLIGTGAFMLDDYVSGSAISYVRNPNYWKNDPFFPENQLPYLDSFKILIIPDKSTQMAGLRTGKIDNLLSIRIEDVEPLLMTNPELEWRWDKAGIFRLSFRNDTSPFDDARVRRALWLAIDHPTILEDYLDGKGQLLTSGVRDIPEHGGMFIPLEELPERVQEMYQYHPDKARQLLAEAGYPNGFKTEVICWSTEHVDMLSIIKAQLAEVGIELILDVRDQSVYSTITTRKSHTQGIMSSHDSVYAYVALTDIKKGGSGNYAIADDPEIGGMITSMRAAFFDNERLWATYTEPTATRPNWATYLHDQAWYIDLPVAYRYFVWQPWLKGYGGVRYGPTYHCDHEYQQFIWVDQDLKKAMKR